MWTASTARTFAHARDDAFPLDYGAGVAKNYDVAVVGGGILGLATARALQRQRPGVKLALLEKEPTLASHQTGHNSGVLHSGVYYTPGSLKAELCRRGKEQMEAFAAEHEIPHRKLGKLIVALDESELRRLADLETRAVANGVPDLRVVEGPEIQEIEPEATGVRALHVPHTGVIDYLAVANALADEVRAADGDVLVGREVERAVPGSRGVTLQTRDGEVRASAVVACAGLQSDRFAHRSGIDADTKIIPFRGDYYTLTGPSATLVRGLVYPVPDPRFPFLGVHFTRKVDDTVVAGPNAVLSLARESYRRLALNPRDAIEAVTFPGVWRFALRYGRIAAAEVARDVSKRAFLADMRRYVPAVSGDDLTFGPSGFRAQALTSGGGLVVDFVFAGGDRMLHVLNAPSPGATSSLAIGDEIAARAVRDLLADG
jgi:L-2-hydroxyglutarate oxidase LhgO